MLRELLLGFVKVHILYHAGQEAVYGAWLTEELAHHGYRISPGTLYPTLRSLESQGYLESQKRTVAGRVRKYYTLTPAGRAALDQAREKAAVLLAELREDDAVRPSRDERP